MGTLKLKYGEKTVSDGHTHHTLTSQAFAKFNAGVLGLGRVDAPARVVAGLAAFLDLEGFTEFSKQIDPQLVVPNYLDDFLNWIFEETANQFVHSKTTEEVVLWGALPMYAKFMGDGLLFLWDTEDFGPTVVGNIAISLRNICVSYVDDFVPKHEGRYTQLPRRLRVGIARGQVLSIGNGSDFVGPCINMAARLQKLGGLSFAMSRRGCDPDQCFKNSAVRDRFVVKRTSVRGISDDELVIVIKEDFDKIIDDQKRLFR